MSMSDLYHAPDTGFEGTASDHIKQDMQRIFDNLTTELNDQLRSIRFFIHCNAWSGDPLEGSFEIDIDVLHHNTEESITYKHRAPTLDIAYDHILRHVKADLEGHVSSGNFILPKLIAAQ